LDPGLLVGSPQEGELAFEEVFAGVKGDVGLVRVEVSGQFYGFLLGLVVGFVQRGFKGGDFLSDFY
jgi:hypothetical protein